MNGTRKIHTITNNIIKELITLFFYISIQIYFIAVTFASVGQEIMKPTW